jgi:predicted O-methyltransferase YrrM
MHLVASRLTWVLADWELNAALIMMAFLLLFPPLFFLGMVPTLLIRKITQLTDETGMVTGKVFALSAASGILILPVLGFWIIPHFGLTHPSLFLGLLIGGIALAGLLKEKKYLALVLIPVALFSFSKREVFGQSKNVRVLEFSEGLLGQVLVADVFVNGKGQPINDRMLFVNRMGQTVMNNQTGNSQYLYITFASAAASVLPEGSKALLLGLGGGSMANALDNLKFEVDAVELDPRIAKVAQNYFGLSKGINVVVDDARHYLETTEKKYDLVFFDVFKGDVLPGQVLSKEAFERANALLNPGGLMIVNLNGFITGEIGKPGRSIFQTLQAADLEVNLLPTPGEEENRNNLFIASKGIKDFSTLRLPLLFKGQPVSLSTVFESVKKFNGDQMYTDDKNSLERDNLPAASKWRRDYNTGFVPFLENNQVPLFK